MSDNWSLEDKWDLENGCGAYIYYKKDIDTLRKKLIEDIEELFKNAEDTYGKYPDKTYSYNDYANFVKYKINKRFGVEE